jgi:hypothetical protein
MILDAQIIEKDGKKEFAVLSYDEYLKVVEMIEDYEDLMLLRQAKNEDKDNEGKSLDAILEEFN